MEAHNNNTGFSFLENKRVHPMIHSLVVQKYATYYELLHVFTFDEIVDLLEILIVSKENEAIRYKSLREKG